jgi:hypothetical protein
MTKRRRYLGRALSAWVLGLLFLTSCDDEPPTGGTNPPATTTVPPSSSVSFLRAAPLAFDARTVDVVITGSNGDSTIRSISYANVSDYLELSSGDYRVQVFPAGTRRTTIAETSVSLSSDESVTVALVGLSGVNLEVFEDDRVDGSARAGVTMVNSVPDYPAPFDLMIRNGPRLFEGVSYLEATDATEVVPGRYDIELRRSGTNEVILNSTGHMLSAGATYTVFAAGSLRRGDLQIVVASDVP